MKINWNSFYRDLLFYLRREITEEFTLKCAYSPRDCEYIFVLTIDEFNIMCDIPDEVIFSKDYFTLLQDTIQDFLDEYKSIYGG